MKLAPLVLILLLFTSLAHAQQPQVVREWLTVAPLSAGAEVLMPLAPTSSERTLEPVAGQKITVKTQISVLEEKHTFVFGFHDQVLPKDAQAGDKALDGAVKGAIASTLGALDKVSVVRSGGLNGREVTYTLIQGEKNKMRVASRFYLDGGRLYQLSYIAPDADFNSGYSKKYLESFKHLPKK
jgi:hypothetical protein